MLIYIVEDDTDIRELESYAMKSSGYEVQSFGESKSFFKACTAEIPQLVILDVMLPDFDGLSVLEKMRRDAVTKNVPVILVTAKGSEMDKVKGLDMGADDYITKPFSVLELISRVRAILRRCSVDDRQDVIKLGQIVFDDSKHIVTSCGEECNLTFKEYELLKYLLKNKGMALTRENIILNVWGYDFEGESRTVDMHITTLRQKLGSCGNLIKTVRNVGYKAGVAQNPIIQTKYTADPTPMVYNDTVFLYTTHDEDDAEGFKMLDWLLYTSTDMVNWTDHGAVASLKSFDWVKRDNGAWAEQVIERNGKFYMYCPIHGNGIGVLVSDSPYGPFKDPLNKPLVWQKEHWYDIDPTVFIDDDGQAYMYWGNPNVYYVKLNEDMISYSGEIVQVENKPEHYQEGPWVYKRNGHYYMAFASTCCPEGIGYAMSDKATGPWSTKGYIMRPTERSRGNHPGIIDYKGSSYVFGLNYDLLHLETLDHKERRSVSVAKMHYNPDGTIKEVPYWQETKLEQIENFNPYRRVEAETMAWGYGLKAENHKNGGLYITDIDDNEYLCVRGVDFGKKGAKKFSVSAACVEKGGMIEIRLDSTEGPVIGSVSISPTGGLDIYKQMSCRIKNAKGVHDLYFCFKGEKGNKLFNLDYWEFE